MDHWGHRLLGLEGFNFDFNSLIILSQMVVDKNSSIMYIGVREIPLVSADIDFKSGSVNSQQETFCVPIILYMKSSIPLWIFFLLI